MVKLENVNTGSNWVWLKYKHTVGVADLGISKCGLIPHLNI